MDILEEIVAHKRLEVERQKEVFSPFELYRQAERAIELRPHCNPMSTILRNSASGIIAEFKRRSPSKGWIKEDGRPERIPHSYAQNGAAALSILTDEKYFGERMDFIQTARPLVPWTPILRKDFIIDEYQLFQARIIGADAVLLIAADLTITACKNLARIAHELGLQTLLEIHTEAELDYVDSNIDMLGVNNRNLGTFHTDVANSYRLAEKLRSVCCDSATSPVLVSESGISNPQTVRELREAGFRGFLIGETFMKTADPGKALNEFISAI